MGTTKPLKTRDDVAKLKQYFIEKGQIRNYAIIAIGLNTSIKISDLLSLRWGGRLFF